ncbi:DUF45 domain-containing protein [Parabacteroides sp. 52]|uniref:M48 family metallopeptidase n=1 Tax=unclassified Parabacteroides TaxID=2649774 RepID=UPI0013D691B3|nr:MULTISPECIES: YgjP-like metallopeptidase domain-containing protein [unclassified Parabacteroides]MDH6534224.1 putative metal-dependent hydrolase [Parabacteroides sp. PM5-20]NDV55391.1 DUF45 domain-containing protein [Parabacteroides sp. 52]
MEKEIQDNELGVITLLRNPRNKRYTLKIKAGRVIAVMPEWGDEKFMLEFIERSKAKLIRLLPQYPKPPLLDETTQMQTASFQLRIIRREKNNWKASLQQGMLTIGCPSRLSIEEDVVQNHLLVIIRNVFRMEAKRLLPDRLSALAQQHGFTYSSVRINNSQSRWGSCSGRKSINLSLYLMQLPWHLIDYVLLHELCHTIEMNHSDRFWDLLNKVTDNKAYALRRELKQQRML